MHCKQSSWLWARISLPQPAQVCGKNRCNKECNAVFILYDQNKKRYTSSTLPIVTTSILNFSLSNPFWLYLDTTIFSKPNFSASAILCSMRCTARISPLNPTSPAKQTESGSGTSSYELSNAHNTAKSMDGSSTFNPPAIFRKTSFTPKWKPPFFSKTASNNCRRRRSKPETVRCGVP